MQNIYNKDYSKEGPVKLCPICHRFLPIDDNRRMLSHKKFLTNEECQGTGK